MQIRQHLAAEEAKTAALSAMHEHKSTALVLAALQVSCGGGASGGADYREGYGEGQGPSPTWLEAQ